MIRLKTFSKAKWGPIATEHSGKTPHHQYPDIKDDPNFQSKRVIRGWKPPLGGSDGADELSTTGFLEDETGNVIAGVHAIPKNAPDNPAE